MGGVGIFCVFLLTLANLIFYLDNWEWDMLALFSIPFLCVISLVFSFFVLFLGHF